jgi:Tautomerase enzyme
MPLLRIDVIEGRNEEELKELLDAIHAQCTPLSPVLNHARRDAGEAESWRLTWRD